MEDSLTLVISWFKPNRPNNNWDTYKSAFIYEIKHFRIQGTNIPSEDHSFSFRRLKGNFVELVNCTFHKPWKSDSKAEKLKKKQLQTETISYQIILRKYLLMQNLIPFQYTHRAQFLTVFFRGDQALFSYQNFHCGCMATGFLGLPMVLAFTSLKFKTCRHIVRLLLVISSKQVLPHVFDIPKFLSSKWLSIIDLHCFDEFIPKKKNNKQKTATKKNNNKQTKQETAT